MSERSGIAVYLIRRAAEAAEILLLRRASPRFLGEWFPVEGWIEAGESSEHAALRELREETAIDPIELYRAEIEPVPSPMGVPIHVFVGFTTADATVILDREHSCCEWLPPEEAIRRLPLIEQRRVLQRIVAGFVTRPPPQELRIEVSSL